MPAQQLAMPTKATKAFDKGATLINKHDFEASLAYFQKAIELAPNLFPPYHNLALAQYNLGRLDDAAKNFEKAIELSKGTFGPSFFGLAMVLYERREFTEAQRAVQQGLLVDPGSPVGQFYLGLTQYSLGNTAEAQRNALEVVRSDPRISGGHLLLAHVHERLHDPEAVLADVDTYLKQTTDKDLRGDAVALRERAEQNLAHASDAIERKSGRAEEQNPTE